jgi:hypothetical protein
MGGNWVPSIRLKHFYRQIFLRLFHLEAMCLFTLEPPAIQAKLPHQIFADL